MSLSIEQVEALVQAMQALDVEAEILPDYSGRGMYGRTCIAITSDTSGRAQMALAFAAGQLADEAGIDFDDLPTRTDSMGLGVVIY